MTDHGPRTEVPARERILTAAEELFAEHGYERTSAARLARAANVPQGLVFYHFGTKQNVLLSLVRERSGTMLAELLPRVPAGDPLGAIAELWRRLRGHLGTPSRIQRIMIREIDTHPELRKQAQQALTDAEEQVAGHLARLLGGTGPPTPEQRSAARMLTVTAAVAQLTHGDSGHDLDPDALARLLVDGLGRPG